MSSSQHRITKAREVTWCRS